MTIEVALAIVASLLTIILSVWAIISRTNKHTRSIVEEIVEKALTKNNEEQHAWNARENEILREDITKDLSAVVDRFESCTAAQQKTNKKDYEAIMLLKGSVINSYKRDIRKIYYKFKNTGEISDHDKAYVDEIFPKYEALGGNSDIKAKYKEIQDFYTILLKEKFEEARKNKGENNE